MTTESDDEAVDAPHGGTSSPLLTNIALSMLDEHLTANGTRSARNGRVSSSPYGSASRPKSSTAAAGARIELTYALREFLAIPHSRRRHSVLGILTHRLGETTQHRERVNPATNSNEHAGTLTRF